MAILATPTGWARGPLRPAGALHPARAPPDAPKAGSPPPRKWRACRGTEATQRYVVANGYEADPGAFADRLLMETDPHAVVEGAALAAWAIGATKAIVAVKADYRHAATRLRTAVAGAEAAGYLGTGALDGLVDLHVEVRELQGAYLLGEETALLHALE